MSFKKYFADCSTKEAYPHPFYNLIICLTEEEQCSLWQRTVQEVAWRWDDLSVSQWWGTAHLYQNALESFRNLAFLDSNPSLLSLGGDPEAAYLVSFVGDSFASSNVGDLFKEDISGYVIKPSSAFCAGTFLALKKGHHFGYCFLHPALTLVLGFRDPQINETQSVPSKSSQFQG